MNKKINQPLKFFIFPLINDDFYTKKRINNFLDNLAVSLKNDGLNEFKTEIYIEETWFWLKKYVEIKPRLLGFTINFTKIIDDLIDGNSQKK